MVFVGHSEIAVAVVVVVVDIVVDDDTHTVIAAGAAAAVVVVVLQWQDYAQCLLPVQWLDIPLVEYCTQPELLHESMA